MTLCWSDSKISACQCLPLGPLSVIICVCIILLVSCDLRLSLYDDRLAFNNAFTALRIIADAISGAFAVSALVGIMKMDPTLTRAGVYSIWPLIFLIILSLTMQWIVSLATVDVPAEYWKVLNLVTLADLILLIGLVYSMCLFKRLTLYFEHARALKMDEIRRRQEVEGDDHSAAAQFEISAVSLYNSGDVIVDPTFHDV